MNTTNPHDITPEAIAGLLTRATEQLDDNTVAALRRARNLALEKQALGQPAFALSAGHHIHWPIPHTTYQWMAMAALLVAVLAGGVGYWHHAHEREMSHLDIAILTDDLPMEIFIDR